MTDFQIYTTQRTALLNVISQTEQKLLDYKKDLKVLDDNYTQDQEKKQPDLF